jgi:hypothetical protein
MVPHLYTSLSKKNLRRPLAPSILGCGCGCMMCAAHAQCAVYRPTPRTGDSVTGDRRAERTRGTQKKKRGRQRGWGGIRSVAFHVGSCWGDRKRKRKRRVGRCVRAIANAIALRLYELFFGRYFWIHHAKKRTRRLYTRCEMRESKGSGSTNRITLKEFLRFGQKHTKKSRHPPPSIRCGNGVWAR